MKLYWGVVSRKTAKCNTYLSLILYRNCSIAKNTGGKNYLHFAAEEVNVVLIIKMKDNDVPFIYTRMYLPEFKLFEPESDGKAMLDRIDRGSYLHPKTQGHREWNDVMVNRVREFMHNNNVALESGEFYNVIDGTQNNKNEGCYKLIDGDLQTKWCTSQKRNGIFFVEFKSKDVMKPQSYCLTTGNDATRYPFRNPESWKLLAKMNPDDEWTTISEVKNYRFPDEDLAREEFTLDVKDRSWQYFRFEVIEVRAGDWMQLTELELK